MEMTEELKAEVEAVRAAVNAAVNPHGFKAERLLDEVLAADYGEAWFILESTNSTDKPHKDFFEACYYLHDFATNHKRKGTIIYGFQTNDNWNDLPSDPALACEEFRTYNENQN